MDQFDFVTFRRVDECKSAAAVGPHDWAVGVFQAEGGEVLAVQGADAMVRIRPVRHDPRSKAKLSQAQRLIQKLLATGAKLIRDGRGSPDFAQEVLRLRVVGAEVSSVTNDAVGELTKHAGASLARLVWVGLALGLLGAAAVSCKPRRKSALTPKASANRRSRGAVGSIRPRSILLMSEAYIAVRLANSP